MLSECKKVIVVNSMNMVENMYKNSQFKKNKTKSTDH